MITLGISITIGIIFAKNNQLAIMFTLAIFLAGTLFTDFYIPTWESNQFIQFTLSHSFFNLMFRSIIIIIYADDRCTGESKVITYFKSEEDMLWVWFEHSIYQLIIIRIIGYFALYIQANSETIWFNKLIIRNKSLEKLFHFMSSSNGKVNSESDIIDDGNETNENETSENERFEAGSSGIGTIEIGTSGIGASGIGTSGIGASEIENNSILNMNQNERKESSILNDEMPKSLAIAWNNLSFSKKSFLNKKLILNNLRGTINFGTITALMGSSDAGKTTLLQCINGMKLSGLSSETEFYVNKENKIKSVFIIQEHKHHLLTNITVRESLMYSSLLKNNIQQNNSDSNEKIETIKDLEKIIRKKMEFTHKLNVNKILREMMLTNCADNKVSQCSEGEQKRLLIGLELTSKIKPNLMCIDEPTIGLDSYAAEQVTQFIH